MIMKFSILHCNSALPWFVQYGPKTFRRADSIGYAVTVILYAIVYVALGNLSVRLKLQIIP